MYGDKDSLLIISIATWQILLTVTVSPEPTLIMESGSFRMDSLNSLRSLRVHMEAAAMGGRSSTTDKQTNKQRKKYGKWEKHNREVNKKMLNGQTGTRWKGSDRNGLRLAGEQQRTLRTITYWSCWCYVQPRTEALTWIVTVQDAAVFVLSPHSAEDVPH